MKYLSRSIRAVEIMLAISVVVMVIINGVSFFIHSPGLLLQSSGFQAFVDRVLLYVIGLEFAMMIIKRDPSLVIEVLIFATARKMVITMENGTDFLMATLAIFLLFSARFFLLRKSSESKGHIL